MPGIVGLITKMPRVWAEPQLARMVEALRHESFYVTGTWIDESSGIYVGWVARQNSFSEGMPLRNERDDVTLVFSGEDYREPDTARRLKERGHSCEEGGPSYLVHLYEEDPDFLKNLNGRFQGATSPNHARSARQRSSTIVLVFNAFIITRLKTPFIFPPRPKPSWRSAPNCAARIHKAWESTSPAAVSWKIAHSSAAFTRCHRVQPGPSEVVYSRRKLRNSSPENGKNNSCSTAKGFISICVTLSRTLCPVISMAQNASASRSPVGSIPALSWRGGKPRPGRCLAIPLAACIARTRTFISRVA